MELGTFIALGIVSAGVSALITRSVVEWKQRITADFIAASDRVTQIEETLSRKITQMNMEFYRRIDAGDRAHDETHEEILRDVQQKIDAIYRDLVRENASLVRSVRGKSHTTSVSK